MAYCLDPLRFAKKIARRSSATGMPFDDRVQEAAIGIMKAERNYRPGMGQSFEQYANWMGLYQILDASKLAQRCPMQRPMDFEHSRLFNQGALCDRDPYTKEYQYSPLATGCPDIDQADARLDLAPLLARLPKRLRRVMILRYGIGGKRPLTQPQIGKRLRVTKQRVQQLERQALAMLKEIAGTDAQAESQEGGEACPSVAAT